MVTKTTKKATINKTGLTKKVEFAQKQIVAGKSKIKVREALMTKFSIGANYAKTIVYYYAR